MEVLQQNNPKNIVEGNTLAGYTKISNQNVLDVNMDLVCKVQFLARGHMTKALYSATYSSNVSKDSVRDVLLLSALNNLKLLDHSIFNA